MEDLNEERVQLHGYKEILGDNQERRNSKRKKKYQLQLEFLS
jgi:hypothetical protein